MSRADRDSARHLLAIDTATSDVVVAVGTASGEPIGQHAWPAGHRHGEQLLASIDRLLAEHDVARHSLAAIVVGTGPGAFTGLRVGLATAKALAHGLARPIVGIATAEALLAVAATADGASAADGLVLLLPAGPSDRVLVRPGAAPRLLPAGTEPDVAAGERLVAVDLDGRAAADAVARGTAARAGLGAQLLRMGAGRIAAGDTDDLSRLVPEYVTLPRGVVEASGDVTWSHDRR